ncbi:MAG TPA: coproporphyrinogen-III oxidase family protein [Candidatus Limiplasma sp.]|nr:coproporphyrinogen-III oxidase family protein [Candidatus Limiplasma sp.]HPS81558.1 coproporphyrinogen-III oxidase family protein [Candidatus Limiplasma sp.]
MALQDLEKAETKAQIDWYVQKTLELQKQGLICLDGDFVPSVHYPPITRYDTLTDDSFFSGYTLAPDGCTDLYVHFPFCQQHCAFCHYPGLVGEQTAEKEKYLSYLERELDLSLARLGIRQFKPRSILLGGGTPTFMPPAMLDRFLTFFGKRIDASRLKQYNVDLDPNSILGPDGEDRIRIMKNHGVTRLTIGVQSFDDGILKHMGRPHDMKMAVQSIESAARSGFKLNIEFIYGYPGQTMEKWLETVDLACQMPTDEIQLYRLKVLAYGDFQGQILKDRQRDPNAIPNLETTMRMKATAVELMRSYGYVENLRRVYTRDKRNISQYAYNQCCNLYDQLGFGLTGFSSLRDRFSINTQTFEEYYRMIDEGHQPINRGLIRDPEQQMRWSIILPMKNMWLIKKQFERINHRAFDDLFRTKVNRLIQYGLIRDEGNKVTLTDIGKFVADEVVEQFNSAQFLPFPREAYAEGPLNPYLDNAPEL